MPLTWWVKHWWSTADGCYLEMGTMDDMSVLPQWLFIFGTMILYVLIGIVIHITYGRGNKD
jgi:hypothetical protein